MQRRVDQDSAECLVLTEREGLLGAMGHDLKLRVTRFAIEGDPDVPAIAATFDPASLVVVAAMRDGREDPAALSTSNRRDIEQAIADTVLEARRYPEVRFAARAIVPTDTGHRVRGALSLHGVERELELNVTREGDRWVAEVLLHQPDFGIRPYSAMLGALKVKADVRVRVAVPAAT
jgi:polyisoprenoid-binding protein YceI